MVLLAHALLRLIAMSSTTYVPETETPLFHVHQGTRIHTQQTEWVSANPTLQVDPQRRV